jgi:hypothetical protein
MSRPVLGSTQPPIEWVPEILCLGVKWLGLESDSSLPSSAEVKNVWSYTDTPHLRLQLKHRDNFTFTLPNIFTEIKSLRLEMKWACNSDGTTKEFMQNFGAEASLKTCHLKAEKGMG